MKAKFALLGLALAISSTAMAKFNFFHPGNIVDDGVLYTMTIITPDEKPFKLDSADMYRGTADSACSDLHLAETINFADYDEEDAGLIYPEEYPVFADFYPLVNGKFITCEKMEFHKGNRTWSTGEIRLSHDENERRYTEATPDHVVLDFSN